MNAKKLANVFLAVVVFVIVFNMVGLPFKIRFVDLWLNYFSFVILCLAIPFAVCFRLFVGSYKNWRLAVFSVLIFPVIFSPFVFVSILAWGDMLEIKETNIDISYAFLQEVEVDGVFYRLYRVDGGATTTTDLELRKEYEFMHSIRLVKAIYRTAKIERAELKYDGNNILKISVEHYDSNGSVTNYDVGI